MIFILLTIACTAVCIATEEGTSPLRQLESRTQELLDSRLIYVYDEGGCRELEGLQQSIEDVSHLPLHRHLALTELEKRLQDEFMGRRIMDPEGDSSRFIEEAPTVPQLRTTYLEALQMEIADVPEGLTLQDLERVSEDLPCVKYVSRDDVKFAEKAGGTTQRGLKGSGEPYLVQQPSDPLYQYQWSLHPGNETSYGTDVESVWTDWGWYGSEDMIIAIIDSGCNLNHPDMRGQAWRNAGETDCHDGIDNDGNGYIDDCWGWDFVEEDNDPTAESTSHGTAAAGIIAANSDNDEGVTGICWNCKLMCLRFISDTEGTVANEVRAIDYAVKMGAKISNNSYGGYAQNGSRVEQDAIERAHRRGHLFVTSAGNNNVGTDSSKYMHTPSGYPVTNVIAVGASTETGRKTSFSNWGPKSVHVFAPGRNIISTGREGYLINQGTSFAAPHIAGIAGLLWSKFPELHVDQVVKILTDSCRPAKELKNSSRCGGIINAAMALKQAEKTAHKGSRMRSNLPSHMEVTTDRSSLTINNSVIGLGDGQNVRVVNPGKSNVTAVPAESTLTATAMSVASSDPIVSTAPLVNLSAIPLDTVLALQSPTATATGSLLLPVLAMGSVSDASYGVRASPHPKHLDISHYNNMLLTAPTVVSTPSITSTPTNIVPVYVPASPSLPRASLLSTAAQLGSTVTEILPTLQRLVNVPVESTLAFVNSGLDWFPTLSVTPRAASRWRYTESDGVESEASTLVEDLSSYSNKMNAEFARAVTPAMLFDLWSRSF